MTELSKKVITFGCRLNNLESEFIDQQLKQHSIDKNTFIFNTCAVTSEAERKARQSIRKIKKENPNAKIVVTGCSAQIDPNKWLEMKEVSNVIGNLEKTKKPEFACLMPPSVRMPSAGLQRDTKREKEKRERER